MKLTNEQELLQKVISRAWEDEIFKKELLENPISAIEKVTGKKLHLPKGKKIIVQDQTDESVVFINVPSGKNQTDDVELDEKELELVSGGSVYPFPFLQLPDFTKWIGGEDGIPQ